MNRFRFSNNFVQLQKYQSLIDDAVKKGAKVLFGGKPNVAHKGHFFEPTVLINVNHSMEIMREETFGPVMPIMRVSSDEEVIKLANDCKYGLSASIFTGNYARGYELAKKIQAGGSVINDWVCTLIFGVDCSAGIKHDDPRFAIWWSESFWFRKIQWT